ncbi:hypothetical protein GCM10010232_13020 [Streptomyces amakusaensis]|uniref:Uncharacterized protein n=1 Tax=Streptomyces amakusaensis TaxID=67271 RepID=A0ABW0ABF2_9ACTN
MQGYNTTDAETAGLDVPAGETVARIPAEIIERYAREYLAR